jgi:Lrp/AsnC family transcriptional regulator, leucine-responsive regulatory protein
VRIQHLDQLDRAILSHLQRDARTVSDVIADAVGLSPAAVQRRIKRLRETGVIDREVAVVEPGALGLAMTFVVGVQLEREHRGVLDDFGRRMREDPAVQQCYYVTGESDFILIVVARSMQDYDDFTGRSLFHPDIRRFTTSVVMNRVKVGLTVPLADPPDPASGRPAVEAQAR